MSVTASQPQPHAIRWMALAFAAEAVCAAVVLALRGTGEHGTDLALMATARLSFLLFWAAYAGGALATLFGPVFQPLKRRGRVFGLAFASAHTVHAGLVAWLCWIGATPVVGVFVLFGTALVFMYLLALASVARVRRMLGTVGWRVLRIVGMNVIAYAFAVDFLRFDRYHSIGGLLAYAPFGALSVLGPALVAAALLMQTVRTATPRLDAVTRPR